MVCAKSVKPPPVLRAISKATCNRFATISVGSPSKLARILSDKGSVAWRRARSSVDSAVSEAQNKAGDAAGAVRDVSDNFVDAVDASIKNSPYATLALVAGLGFLFGATWRK